MLKSDLEVDIASISIIKTTFQKSDIDDKKCIVQALAPKYGDAPTTRVNHLGNTDQLTTSRFDWDLPHFPSGKYN